MVESIARELVSAAATVVSRSAEAGGNILEMTKTATFQNYSYLSAFILLVWDYVDTFADEISLIWSQPSSPSKFLYLFIRYSGLGSQLANFLIASNRFSHIPVLRSACAGWYAFEVVTFWAIYASSELILMMKVYDLYDHSCRVGICLILLNIAETLAVSICCWHTLDSLSFDPICNGVSVPPDIIVIVFMIVFSQTVLWSLTFMKRDVGKWKQQTILMAFLGDGKWPWFIMLIIFLIIVPAAFASQFVLPHLIFSWPSTMLSVGTCRLLLTTAKQLRDSEPKKSLWTRELPSIPILTPGRHQQQQQQEHLQHLQQQQQKPHQQQQRTSQAMSEVHTPRSEILSSPRLPVSSPGHHTVTSYVSSRLGPSLYPTLYGDSISDPSHDSLTTMTSLEEDDMQNNFLHYGGSVHLEIGSVHAASSSIHSEEMRRFWNDMA